MNNIGKIGGMLLLVMCMVGAQAQSPAQKSAAKPSHAKPRTQEQLLLEQLNEKFQELEQINGKYNNQQQEIDDLKRQLQETKQQADSAQSTATQARQALEKAQLYVGHNDEAVTTLQNAVGDLKATSASLVDTIQADQKATRALETPDVLHFKNITLVPGGFVAGETVWRQRGIGGDVNTQFTGIPFSGQTAGLLSEFNASGRQSRLSLLAEGKLPATTLRGYYEADFLSSGTTSNNNQSNSYTMRIRQAWAQAMLHSGWTLTAGQMWSLATEYKSGLTNTQEATPLTIDAQYNVGFTWARQYGFRVVKSIGNRFWLGGAVEEAQTLNIGGHNLPTILYQQAGNGGGLYNSTANYSFNYAPDLIAKVVYQPDFGHFELFAIGRFFRDRAFPNDNSYSGSSTLTADGAFTAKTAGGGAGVNARVSLLGKTLDVGAHILAGNGLGRYSTSTPPDATAHPDGSLELLTGGSALGTVEWRPMKRIDLYAYYGGEYAKRAFYNTGYTVTTVGSTYGYPILAGYGAPNNIVSGCYTEVVPSTSNGAYVPGSATNCSADNRNIQEGTFGYWYRFYQGGRGTLQQGIQYSYAVRHTWQGIGVNGLGFSPKAIDNMIFTSFRYYFPK
jgi:multidrug efflux pump subunit AcrA (membrane-fusion protein)